MQVHDCLRFFLLMLAGDVAPNPGPPRYPCGLCYKPVASTHRGIYCEGCYSWWHAIKCAKLTPAEYSSLGASEDPWICKHCDMLSNFSDSFYSDDAINQSYHSNMSSELETDSDIFDQLNNMRKQHPKKFLFACLNINSLRNKFHFIQELLTNNTVDLLILLETKIDSSFPDAQFAVDNFHLWRKDRTAHGGGVAVYLRSQIEANENRCLNLVN